MKASDFSDQLEGSSESSSNSDSDDDSDDSNMGGRLQGKTKSKKASAVSKSKGTKGKGRDAVVGDLAQVSLGQDDEESSDEVCTIINFSCFANYVLVYLLIMLTPTKHINTRLLYKWNVCQKILIT